MHSTSARGGMELGKDELRMEMLWKGWATGQSVCIWFPWDRSRYSRRCIYRLSQTAPSGPQPGYHRRAPPRS